MTAADGNAHRPSDVVGFPDFVVIGGQKTGSTFLMVQLSAHPEIFMPPQEIAFFEDPEYAAGIDSLRRQFPPPDDTRVLGFKRPSLLGDAKAPERMHEAMPNGKVIAILRDPVERAVSAYYHTMKHGLIPLKPIEEGLPPILAGETDDRWPAGRRIVDWGLYHKHLCRFEESFGRSQMLVLLYDDIRRDAVGTLQRTFDFLGVDPDFEMRVTKRRPMPGVYNMTYQRILAMIRPFRSRLSDDRSRVMPYQGVGGLVSRLVFWPLERLVLEKFLRARRPKLSAELEAQVAGVFEQDVRALQGWLGIDLGHWASLRHADAAPAPAAVAIGEDRTSG